MSSVLFIIHTKIERRKLQECSTDAEENLEGKVEEALEKYNIAEPEVTSCQDPQKYREDRLAKILSDVLTRLSIKNASWCLSDGMQYWQVMFTAGAGEQCDRILNSLIANGIGNNKWSSISIVPITIHFPSIIQRDESSSESIADDGCPKDSATYQSKKDETPVEKKKSQFLQSVRSRLTVAQVIDVVKTGSMLTFDYIVLTVMASIIAAIGLLENSSVLLVASMLVSPLMGPILAGTFGIVIRYKYLWKMGIKNEMIGLMICVLCGFSFGLVCALIGDRWSSPTKEMTSRGEPRGLYVGVLVAIPSGAGVALSVLGGNQGSLVGVAISASLLPPAVNGGICWAFSIVRLMRADQHDPGDLAWTGLVSMGLTLLNIVVIFIMGSIVLKIKEVAPKTGTAVTTSFWKEDIRLTRSYLKDAKSETDVTGLLREWERLNGLEDDSLVTLKGDRAVAAAGQFKQFVDSVRDDETYAGVVSYLSKKPNVNPMPREWGKESSSRFTVTKAYFPSSTTFSSNARFTVRRLDEEGPPTTDPSLPLLGLQDSSRQRKVSPSIRFDINEESKTSAV